MRIAIGDIHGCQRALQTMLDVVRPSTDDLVVTLGDYVDRGPDSKAVIDTLLELQKSHNLVHLMGNHEIQMIRAMEASHHRDRFLSGLCGGMDTLNSYGGNFDDIPEDHWVFIKSAGLYHELEDYILSGKTIVCGHSIQGDLPTNLGYAICLDTCAYGGGWLTAMDIDTGKLWQTNQRGQTRELHVGDL
jgi:serine/threonine protein phosphatase 1